MKFTVVDGEYADVSSIYDDFVKDYIYSTELKNTELRLKYGLSHKEFKDLCDKVKMEHGINRRNTAWDSAKYYSKHVNGFVICKCINRSTVYIGIVPTEDLAIKLVEICKKLSWDVNKCKHIVKNYKEYVV